MRRKLNVLMLGLVLAAGLVATPLPARATLGEQADSVESDRMALSSVPRATIPRNGYTVQNFTSGAIDVREYVSSTGVVFGIAWNGLSHPDLTPLLGAYAVDYRQALEKTPRKPGRRHLQVKGEGVIVEKWGHMRNLQGRAYLPALIPPGVIADEIK